MNDAPERIMVARKIGTGLRDVIGGDRVMSLGYVDLHHYILDTPEALAAAPGVAALIEAAEVRGWNAAIEAGAQLIEGTAYTNNGSRRTLEPVSTGLVGMDMHHATIASAIRALKETPND